MARYTKIPTDTFEKLQINAGFITTSFNPQDGIAAPYFATTGGLTFATNAEYTDFGDDVDNCPKNTKELKRLTGMNPTLSGTAVTVNAEICKRFIGAADIHTRQGGANNTKVTPRLEIDADNDFADIWFIGDYTNENGESDGKGIALRLINAFNTAGFQWTTADRGKGTFAFEFTGHVSIANQTQLPFEVWFLGAGAPESNSVTPNVVDDNPDISDEGDGE